MLKCKINRKRTHHKRRPLVPIFSGRTLETDNDGQPSHQPCFLPPCTCKRASSFSPACVTYIAFFWINNKRWIGSIPSGGSADAVSTSSPWATGATGGARTDAALRSWMSGGRAPRRAQLLQWLLWRVEVVDVENSGGLRWRPAGSNKMRTAGKKWSLEIAHVHGESSKRRVKGWVQRDALYPHVSTAGMSISH